MSEAEKMYLDIMEIVKEEYGVDVLINDTDDEAKSGDKTVE